ncbi:proteasome assembly chaperone 2 [Orycteropus afer afer]|uniref:Proteasome assembly chaperone 2 n=1 Tax=Orycteropus afer afer TaxID=1230840 RepID=A0A8B7APC6_ORYAF|nr:proteasome assembly chaperone 2 [Orycteropus afer afer]
MLPTAPGPSSSAAQEPNPCAPPEPQAQPTATKNACVVTARSETNGGGASDGAELGSGDSSPGMPPVLPERTREAVNLEGPLRTRRREDAGPHSFALLFCQLSYRRVTSRRSRSPFPPPVFPGWVETARARRSTSPRSRVCPITHLQTAAMFVPCADPAPELTGFTFLMPAVSVGNVGQLAIDLIISTLNMFKVGYFYTDCLVPMVGNNPYATTEENSTELSINAEVYSLPSRKLVALQLRSIFIKYKSKPFCEKLLSWVKSSNCARVIVLSSSHSYHRNDLQLCSTPFRYLLTPSMQKSVQNKINSLNWEEMEKSQCIPGIEDSELCVRIPGGGITKILYEESCSREISMAVLLKFVSEGDNIPDALGLVEYLNEWLQIIKPHIDGPTASALPWKIPSSWRLLFGSGLPPALF